MNRLIHKNSIAAVRSILFYIAIGMMFSCQPEDALIKDIENGLLPMVLIEGEAPFKLEDRMAYYKVPGVSIAVIKNFEIAWTKQYGVMDSEIQNPVAGETVFNVGSLSKGVAALTVLSFVKERKIDLYKDVNEQLVSWKIPENEFTAQGTVTPLGLMNHSGGAMFSPSYSYLADQIPTTLQVLKGEPPAQSGPVVIDKIPGTEYQYSNAGYTILQQLMIDVGGESFPDITNQNIFQPLDIQHSTFQQPLPEEFLKQASAGHMPDGRPLEVKRYFYPHMSAGGLWTTTGDYAKFIIEVQKAHAGTSDKIISKELAQQMLTSHTSKQYGLGVFLRDFNGERNYFGHMGDNRGFFAGYAAHLTDGYGVVVFTNAQNGAGLIREISNGVARVYGWNGYLPEPYETVDLDERSTNQFPGRYALGADEYFEVKKQGDQLFIDRFDNAQLFHVGEGKFVTQIRNGYLQYNTDSKQAVVSMVYYFADELGRFLSEPHTCLKMKPGEKIPLEILEEGNIPTAIELYRDIRKTDPSDYYVSESRLNRLGYMYLQQSRYDEALAIFRLNVEFHPESANCYDSLAEAFMKKGDNKRAIINYRKSLVLNPGNSNAAEKLKELDLMNGNQH